MVACLELSSLSFDSLLGSVDPEALAPFVTMPLLEECAKENI